MAGFDKVDPANPCLYCSSPELHAWAGAHPATAAGLKPHRDMQVPELDEETLHRGAHVSRWRSGMASNMRALTS